MHQQQCLRVGLIPCEELLGLLSRLGPALQHKALHAYVPPTQHMAAQLHHIAI